jgi:uncharacterized membrane protein
MDSLDAIRGVAIIAMVVYHALYDVTDIFGYSVPIFSFLTYLEPPFAGAFILLSGVSSRYSHSNIKRGIKVLLLGFLVSAVTGIFIPSQAIHFGILTFMGCSILLFELLRPLCDKIPKMAAAVIYSLLFILTFNIYSKGFFGIQYFLEFNIPEFLKTTPFLYPLGFPEKNFFSADYFPMIPWFFIFLLGTVVGIPIKEHKLSEKFYTIKIPFWAAAGRNTLLIYVLHQPVIYGLLSLFTLVFR